MNTEETSIKVSATPGNKVAPLSNSETVSVIGKVSDLHYVSCFSGVILTILLNSIYCLIPIHNPLEEPMYWYDLFRLLSAMCKSQFN